MSTWQKFEIAEYNSYHFRPTDPVEHRYIYTPLDMEQKVIIVENVKKINDGHYNRG